MVAAFILVFIAYEACGSCQGGRRAEGHLITVLVSVEVDGRVNELPDEQERHAKA